MSNDDLRRNSKRKYLKSSYTPLILPTPDENAPGDALGLASLVRSIEVQPSELDAWKQQVQSEGGRAAVDAIGAMAQAVSGRQILTGASQLAALPGGAVAEAGTALLELRNRAANQLSARLTELASHYQQIPVAPAAAPATAIAAPRVESPAPPLLAPTAAFAGAVLPNPPRTEAPSGPVTKAPTNLPATIASVGKALSSPPPALLTQLLSVPAAAALPNVLAWAARTRPEAYQEITTQLQPAAASPLSNPSDVVNAIALQSRRVLLTKLFLDALTRRPLQPIGLLHLERLEMTPQDIERGELLYSLPLSPHEKVTLAHKEWSITEKEFTDFIEDYLENYSEKGVTETTDIASSNSTQNQHTNSLSMSQSSGATGAVTITPPVNTSAAGSVVSDTTSQEASKSESRQTTSLASARTVQDHKVSFTVTTVSGVQDFTARVLENRNTDHTMRVDYFRRMRKWHTDLYRYGVRMTYDVVLPDPGARVRARVRELQSIDATLATTFDFGLIASEIQPWNWENLADQYGAVLPAPPDDSKTIQVEQTINLPKSQPDGSGITNWLHEETLTLSIPGDYTATSINGQVNVNTWGGGPTGWVNIFAGNQWPLFNAGGDGWVNGSFNFSLFGLPGSGNISFLFLGQNLHDGRFIVTATASPTQATMDGWRMKCWAILRDAAYSQFLQQRSQLRDRRSALAQLIAGDDAIVLRRREREEIMHLVLAWLFPGFSDASSVLNDLPDPGELDFSSWQQVMEYGEYVKFVQAAIDWDNVTVQLYPYFWDTLLHESEKLLLDHPDPLHREFLRAGAARVVLAIQPGFEDQMVSLLDQGNLGQLPAGNRFEKVVTDVQAANAAYAQTAQENPDGDNPGQPGVLIGSWTDYTPTSALDIDVVRQPVIVA